MKSRLPKFEFHVSRVVRDQYQFEEEFFSWNGNVLFANPAASRRFAEKMNRLRDVQKHPELAVRPGALNAMGLIDEALHAVIALYRQQRDPRAMEDALAWYESRLGAEAVSTTLLTFTQQFPPIEVYRGKQSAEEWLAQSSSGLSHRAIALEEMTMLWLANANPAFRQYRELFDDTTLSEETAYKSITTGLKDYFETRPRFGPENQNLIEMLRAPALAAPDSLEGQLAFMREKWFAVLGDFLQRILVALDIFKEEEIATWMRFHPHGAKGAMGGLEGDSSVAAIPHFNMKEPEYERFSADTEWMPRTVMMAKSVYVWLDQLSKKYRRHIHSLSQVPDEELDLMARRGFNSLWLIGLWERSRASQRIKQLTGNPEAAASAYSLDDYVVAADLGGESAFLNLRDRAMLRGIRMGSDMVPNHMGIDSRWVVEHPDWFIQLPYSPFPSYRFDGPDVSSDGRVEIKIEDHYYDRTDAAVVFRRVDRWSGDTRYVYHGNDGTSFPWNDTAQLDYLKPEVREAVIQNILHVARLSPIIRFDAAMTLTKQHYQRLWFPVPGTGGAIPSRAEHGLTKPDFDRAMPNEFWREVVDRVAAEVPGTLLLAEAFWLLEGYFVRTLGMHRVYNSAFMNMLRDEENKNYRSVIKNTIEFDPEILKRYVNFMNNPDERTAVDQFGKGDKYFGVCTLMSTLPGLPMFGHGQIEGFTERYGMEYRRAYHDEQPDSWLVARHEREITPLLHRRALFAEVRDFLLYDFFSDSGQVNEDVFAYSNQLGDQRALVVYNNRYSNTHGWIRISSAYAEKRPDGNKHLRQRTIGDALGASWDAANFVAARDSVTGLEYLYRARDLAEKGMRLELGAYKCHVFLDWRNLQEDLNHPWGALCDMLGGRGVSSLADAIHELQLKPVHDSLRWVLDPSVSESLAKPVEKPTAVAADSADSDKLSQLADRARAFLEQARHFVDADGGEITGLTPAPKWKGDVESALKLFKEQMEGARRISKLAEAFPEDLVGEANKVLPFASDNDKNAAVWETIVSWAAMYALGAYLDPANPDRSGAMLMDALRLRVPMAEIFESLGLEGDDRWRAAARIRALLAHRAWAPGEKPKTTIAPFSWLHDPDVAWLIGVHSYESVRYFNKELFEQLLWWMALPALVKLGQQPTADPKRIEALEKQIEVRMRAAAESKFQVESLFETGGALVMSES